MRVSWEQATVGVVGTMKAIEHLRVCTIYVHMYSICVCVQHMCVGTSTVN